MKRLRRTKLEHGFTLIESTLVIIVIGLLAIVAIPKLVSTDKHEVYIAAHQITADMRYARGLAIADATADPGPYYAVKFYPIGGGSEFYDSYAILAPDGSTVKSMEIPEQMDCSTPGGGVAEWEISFKGIGSAIPGGDNLISLQLGGHTENISVIQATGRISH